MNELNGFVRRILFYFYVLSGSVLHGQDVDYEIDYASYSRYHRGSISLLISTGDSSYQEVVITGLGFCNTAQLDLIYNEYDVCRHELESYYFREHLPFLRNLTKMHRHGSSRDLIFNSGLTGGMPKVVIAVNMIPSIFFASGITNKRALKRLSKDIIKFIPLKDDRHRMRHSLKIALR